MYIYTHNKKIPMKVWYIFLSTIIRSIHPDRPPSTSSHLDNHFRFVQDSGFRRYSKIKYRQWKKSSSICLYKKRKPEVWFYGAITSKRMDLRVPNIRLLNPHTNPLHWQWRAKFAIHIYIHTQDLWNTLASLLFYV